MLVFNGVIHAKLRTSEISLFDKKYGIMSLVEIERIKECNTSNQYIVTRSDRFFANTFHVDDHQHPRADLWNPKKILERNLGNIEITIERDRSVCIDKRRNGKNAKKQRAKNSTIHRYLMQSGHQNKQAKLQAIFGKLRSRIFAGSAVGHLMNVFHALYNARIRGVF